MTPPGGREAVCLIIPPSVFLLDERVFVSLGILKVAAVLEQRGHPVEVVDLSGVENYEEAIRVHASQTKARFFGITITTPQLPSATKVLKAIRKERKDARVIAGGPHPTLVFAAARGEQKRQVPYGRGERAMMQLRMMFDVVVAGDGEAAIFEALAVPWNHRGVVIDADDPKGGLFLTNASLEETPYPARHLVDLDSYHYAIDGERATSLIAQLGCPFGCAFCGGRESNMLRKIRTRSTASILRELRLIHETQGLRAAMLYDDELNVSKTMVELMYGIRDLGQDLGFEWKLRGFVKSQLFTEEQAKAMYAAGFRWILVGFEAGHDRILDNIQKKATLAENTRCMQIAHDAGLKVKALMSVGHAGESEETLDSLERWLLAVKPDDFDVTVITTYPGTPYFDHAVQTKPGIWTYTAKSGDLLHAYEIDHTEVEDFYKGGLEDYQAYVFTDHLTSERIVERRGEIERNVRAELGIPFNAGAPAIRFEHSMGQSGALPPSILRQTEGRLPMAAKLPVVG